MGLLPSPGTGAPRGLTVKSVQGAGCLAAGLEGSAPSGSPRGRTFSQAWVPGVSVTRKGALILGLTGNTHGSPGCEGRNTVLPLSPRRDDRLSDEGS